MKNNKINFKIMTPEKTVFEDAVDQVTLPVTNGEVTILPNHREYIASFKAGEIFFKKGDEEVSMATAGGFLEFASNALVVLADSAERAEEIDLQKAEEARKRAEEIKRDKISIDEIEYAKLASLIEKETARIKVARKHRTRSGSLHLD